MALLDNKRLLPRWLLAKWKLQHMIRAVALLAPEAGQWQPFVIFRFDFPKQRRGDFACINLLCHVAAADDFFLFSPNP